MCKRVLSWIIAVTMVTGSFMSSVPAYAAENPAEPLESITAEDDAAGEETSVVQEDADNDDKTYKETEEVKNEPGDVDEVLENDPEEAPTVNTGAGTESENEEPLPKSFGEVSEDIPAGDAEGKELVLTLRSIDLMYGESADNKDGHLDRLFAPLLTDGEKNYALRTENSKDEDPVFDITYRFFEDKSAFDPDDSSFAKAPAAQKEDAFRALEEAELSKVKAGSRLYVAARAVTSDGYTAFAAAKINILKRPVVVEFPASESVFVSKGNYPENGFVTVPEGSDILSEISLSISEEYTIEKDGEKTALKGDFDEEAAIVPTVSDLITSDVIVDVSGLDLESKGFQPAAATFETDNSFFDDFEITCDYSWPVLVVIDGAVAGEDAEEEIEEIEENKETEEIEDVEDKSLLDQNGIADPDISENEIGFINEIVPVSDNNVYVITPGVTTRSTCRYIDVEIYASRKEDRTGAKKIASTYLNSNKYSYWDSDAVMSGEEKYYKDNAIPIDFEALGAGKWYLFGRFYTGEGDKGYVDTRKKIELTVETASPVVKQIQDATDTTSKNGVAWFNSSEGRNTLLYGLLGEFTGKIAKAEYLDGTGFKAGALNPGRYIAYFSTPCWFSDTFITDSQQTEFLINVKEQEVNRLTIKNYANDTVIKDNDHFYLRKGATLRVGAIVTPTEAPETGVTFESSDPKVISVDATGTIKALKEEGSATITVATKAKDSDGNPKITKSFRVIANTVLKIKSAKFSKGTITEDYAADKEINLEIDLDEDIFCSVKWTVDDPLVAAFDDNYNTDAEEGKANKTIRIKAPGKAVVTANLEGVKTVSCTIFVNGTAGNDKPFFSNGKFLSGFCALDLTKNEVVATGNAALKKESVRIKYYDPVTYYPVLGPKTVTIGKKLYYFDGNHNLYRCTKEGKDKEYVAACKHLINRQGDVLTRWQKENASSGEYYYSPIDGTRVTNKWVPRGKGYTWVNKNGLMLDEDNNPLDEDGLYNIKANDIVGTKTYYFKSGVRQHGFIYFDSDDNETTLKKAAYAIYFDHASGIIHNSVDADHGIFMISGKKYIADDGGRIHFGTLCNYAADKKFITDKTGAVFINSFVNYDDATYYADEDGFLFKDGYKAIGGKIYHFTNYELDISSEGVLTAYTKYTDEGGLEPLYIKSGKKPAEGSLFYTDAQCKKKATNCLLYDADGKVRALDKNGKIVAGPYKVGGLYLFFDPDNDCILSEKDTSGTLYYRVLSYGGKYYACDNHGRILTENKTRFTSARADDHQVWIRVKNSSTGELVTGFETIEGNKYVFSHDGALCKPNFKNELEDEYNNKYYMLNPDYDDEDDYNNPVTWFIYAPGKTVKQGERIYNKDGSAVQNGWVTLDGKKYYVFMSELAPDEGIIKIGGKYYAFNEDYSMHTGWLYKNELEIMDLSTLESREYDGEYYFFFGKNGAMETGWKTMNTIKTDALGNVLDDLTKDSIVTGPKTKIYFNQTDTGNYPIGALARNTDLTVGKKIYRFSADGRILTGKEGPVYNNPSVDAAFDGFKSYRKADGTMARGRTLVKTATGSAYYYFGLDDGIKETNVIRKTGSKWYYYGYNGAMSTTLSLSSSMGDAFAVFNSDGSIKQFELVKGQGTVLKNIRLEISVSETLKDQYTLGKNGLPVTGFQVGSDGRTCYFEDDGRPAGTLATTGNLKLRKIGSKYYMLLGGVLLDSTYAKKISTEVPDGPVKYIAESGLTAVNIDESMFSLLSTADKAEAAKCLKLNEELGHMTPTLALKPDGTVKEGEILHPDGSAYANRLGIVKDNISPFYKQGSSWKIGGFYSISGNNTAEFEAVDIKATMSGKDGETKLLFYFDENRNITSIVDKNTGKKAGGDYTLGDFGELVVCKISNGKLTTGKVRLTENGLTMDVSIDKDYGIGVFLFGE